MREPARKLLHLTDRVREFLFDQHLKVGADHLVTIGFAGLIVEIPNISIASCIDLAEARAILLDLSENPRVRRRCAADHHRIATCLRDHGAGVFWAANVPVADYRNLHRVFDGGNPLPAGLTAVSHLAGAGVQGDSREPATLGHARKFYADDLFVVPAGAELYREGNFHHGADRFENFADSRKIA